MSYAGVRVAVVCLQVVNRFMVGLGVELGPGPVEVHGVGDFSLGSVTPPPPDIFSLPPTQATLAIAVSFYFAIRFTVIWYRRENEQERI